MLLTRRISKHFFERIRSQKKKRNGLLIWLASTFAACDVIVLFVLFRILLPLLLDNTPYLLPEHAQEHTHLSTFTATKNTIHLLAFFTKWKNTRLWSI